MQTKPHPQSLPIWRGRPGISFLIIYALTYNYLLLMSNDYTDELEDIMFKNILMHRSFSKRRKRWRLRSSKTTSPTYPALQGIPSNSLRLQQPTLKAASRADADNLSSNVFA